MFDFKIPLPHTVMYMSGCHRCTFWVQLFLEVFRNLPVFASTLLQYNHQLWGRLRSGEHLWASSGPMPLVEELERISVNGVLLGKLVLLTKLRKIVAFWSSIYSEAFCCLFAILLYCGRKRQASKHSCFCPK